MSREPAHLHPHGKVLAFHYRRENSFRIGVTDDWDSLRRDYFSGRIPALAFRRGAIHLDELGEIYAVTQGVLKRAGITSKSIGGQLVGRAGRRVPQAFDEDVSGRLVALAQCKVEYQLCVSLNRDETVFVPKARIVLRSIGSLQKTQPQISSSSTSLHGTLTIFSPINFSQLRTALGRAYDHNVMKAASNRLLNSRDFPFSGEEPQVVASLRFVALSFTQLQEDRHFADYNLTEDLGQTDALNQVKSAEEVFQMWPSIRNNQIAQDVFRPVDLSRIGRLRRIC